MKKKFLFSLLVILLISFSGTTQHMFYHLLGGLPIVNFTLTGQTVNEANGLFAAWSQPLNAWSKRRKIELNGAGSSLTNFPVVLKLDNTRIDYAQTLAGGADLRFTDNSGSVIPHEISVWDAAGQSIIWVKVPTLAASPAKTAIWMYYGNAAAVNGQDVINTWDTNFKKVMHLQGAVGPIANNSLVPSSIGAVGGANNTNGTGLSYATGIIGTGATFDGVDDWISTGNDAALNIAANTAFTVSLFVKTTEDTGTILNFRSSTNDAPIIGLHIGNNGATTNNGRAAVIIRDDPNNAYAQIVGPMINDGNWHHYALTRNAGSTIELFVDGISYGTTSSAGSGGAMTTDYRSLGSERRWVQTANNSADDRFFAGTIDEVQFSVGAQRPAAWHLASLQMANDLTTFYYNEESLASSLVTLTAQINMPSAQTITVPFTLTGTATSLVDHTAASANITIAPGQLTGSYQFSVLRDTAVDDGETAIFTMGNPTNAAAGSAITVHTVVINDEVLSPPDAVNDNYTLTSLGAQTFNVLANDTDANGDSLQITSVGAPTGGGSVSIVSGKNILFTPNADFSSGDSFTYTISDGRGGSDTATVTITYQIPFTWIGAGADADWTTPANWMGGVVPSATDLAYFNNQCTTYCNPFQSGNISVGGVKINPSFTGALTQAVGLTWTLGASGYIQKVGTFTGSDSNITVNGPMILSGGTFLTGTGILNVTALSGYTQSGGTFTASSANVHFTKMSLSAGTFTAPSANLQIGHSLTNVNSDGLIISGGTFNHNSGTLELMGSYNSTGTDRLTYIDVPAGGLQLNHLLINVRGTNGVGNYHRPYAELASGDTITVLGNLTQQNGRLMGGTISLRGNLNIQCNDGHFANGDVCADGGTTTVLFSGGAAHTYSYAAGALGPFVTVPAGETVTPNGGTTDVHFGRILISGGNFTAPSGTMQIGHDYTNSNADGFLFTSGTFTHNGGTVEFMNSYSSGGNDQYLLIDVPVAGVTFNNLTVSLRDLSNPYNQGYGTIASGDTLTVLGNLTLTNGRLQGGTIDLYGNLSIQCAGGNATTSDVCADGGTFALNFKGTNAQTVSQASGSLAPSGLWTVDKAAAQLTFLSGVTLIGAAQSMTLTNGLVNMAGFNFTIPTTLTVSATSKLLCNGGTLSALTYTISGEVSCGPSAGITWTGLAGDNTWNTPGNWTNNTVPGASDIARFNTMCAGANCNATMNAAQSLKGLFMTTGYTGTITAGATSVAIGTTGWNQDAGTFLGGAVPMTITSGLFALTGGTFTATSGTLTVTSSNWSVTGAPTFNHNSGTLVFTTAIYSTAMSLTSGTVAYNNVHFQSNRTTYNLTGSMTINGTLTLNDIADANAATLNTGTLLAYGNVVFSGFGMGNSGTGLLRIVGSGNQSVSGVATAKIPRIEIASTGGTVTMSGNLYFYNGSFTWLSGTVDASTTSIVFTSLYSGANTIVPGNIEFNNIAFSGVRTTYNITGTLRVNGTLDISDSDVSMGTLNTGVVLAKSHVNFSGFGIAAGTGIIRIGGSGNQTVTGISGARIPTFEINSTGGIVTLAGFLQFNLNYTYNSGVIDAGTSTLNFASTQTIIPGAAITYNNVEFRSSNTQTISTNTMIVGGTLTLDSTGTVGALLGTINALGTVNSTNLGKSSTGLIRVVGSGNQTVTGVSTASFPNFEINSTGGTVTLSGNIYVRRNFIVNSTNVDASASTVMLGNAGFSATVTPNTVTYNSFSFVPSGSNPFALTGTLTTTGTLTFADTGTGSPVTGGAFDARGHVVYSSNGLAGTTAVTMGGAGASNLTMNITSSGARPSGTIIIAKTGGAAVTMTSDVDYGQTGQDVTVTSGVLNMSGNDLAVTDVLTVDVGATLVCNGGWLTYGSVANSGTINCPGFPSYPFDWVGGGSDNNFGTAANWRGGVVPGASDQPNFDSANCGGSCNVTLAANVNVKSLLMTSGYTGTITQNPGVTITMGSHWRQSGGTFIGGNSNITVGGGFYLTGGAFTSTSATLSINKNFTTTGAFTHNSGTVTLNVQKAITTMNFGSKTFNNLNFSNPLASSVTSAGGSSATVVGSLGFLVSCNSATFNSGTINLSGNLNLIGTSCAGNMLVKLTGNPSGQTIAGGGRVPNIEIAAGANNVTMNTMSVAETFLHTSGNLIPIGTLFISKYFMPGTGTYNNIDFNFTSALAINLAGANATVNGTFNIAACTSSTISNGTLAVMGAVTSSSTTCFGDAVIKLVNPAGQTIGGPGGYFPSLTVDNGGAAITQTAAVRFSGSMVMTTGSYNMAGFANTIVGSLSLNTRTITKAGGVLTVSGVPAGTGALFGGTVAP